MDSQEVLLCTCITVNGDNHTLIWRFNCSNPKKYTRAKFNEVSFPISSLLGYSSVSGKKYDILVLTRTQALKDEENRELGTHYMCMCLTFHGFCTTLLIDDINNTCTMQLEQLCRCYATVTVPYSMGMH